VFDAISEKQYTSISKLDLLRAVECNVAVRNFVLDDVKKCESDYEYLFDKVGVLFGKIANGKKRIDKNDFASFFSCKGGERCGNAQSFRG
jgi:hypothetical protein